MNAGYYEVSVSKLHAFRHNNKERGTQVSEYEQGHNSEVLMNIISRISKEAWTNWLVPYGGDEHPTGYPFTATPVSQTAGA